MFRCNYPPEHLKDYARRAENYGYDELWIVEDCFWGGGLASTATALAVTESITVGLGIVPAVVRNAAFVAMEFATLARLYPDRFLPGFGHGVADWMRQVGAFPKSQVKAIEEVAVTVRALLHGETVTIDGQQVKLDNVKLDLPPSNPPPILLGVRGPKSVTLSGRVADGTIVPEASAPAYISTVRQQIAQGIKAAGHNRPHRLTVYAFCSVDSDPVAARNRVRPFLSQFIAGGGLESQLEPLGLNAEVQAMLDVGGKDYLRDHMPDSWISLLAVAGTPDDCAAAIYKLGEAGADSVVLTPLPDQPEDQIDTFAREILPLFK
jgi:alkanesulfonate monooxygenase SsuD/methylene tetrahydromethanopterin reductase-like flavin-dependent oxidoreductase (luciferase family)